MFRTKSARLIECLPALTRDADNVEDVLKREGDDPADAARYGLKSALEAGRAPASVVKISVDRQECLSYQNLPTPTAGASAAVWAAAPGATLP